LKKKQKNLKQKILDSEVKKQRDELIKRKETASNERESINLEISRLDATDANLDKYRADSESKY
jgi:hypothetical protein